MKFFEIAQAFDKIESVSSRLEMMDLLAEMLSKAKADEIQELIYLSQGQLGPSYNEFEAGLGEKLIMEAIVKTTGYSRNEIEKLFREKGDLGKTIEELLKKKKQQALFSEELSIKKVFDNLMKIAQSTGTGSQESKLKLLAELLNSSKPLEAKYIIRIPLGSMRLGIGDPTLMDALAIIYLEEFKKSNPKLLKEIFEQIKTKDGEKKKEEIDKKMRMKLREKIEEKFNLNPDLGLIARELKKNSLNALEKIKIESGIPIRPTLAERLSSAEEIIEKIGKCAVEAKYDGFRLQIHKKNNEIKIFSRHMENITPMFPEIIKGIREQVNAKEAIIEGEALSCNEETGEFLPFQVTIQRKRKYEIKKMSEQFPLKVFLFDLMYLEGKNIMDKPFEERRKELEKIIKKGKIIALTESIITDNPKKLEEFFEECIEKGLEGIIAKDLKAKYTAGARKFSWIKLKRSYKAEIQDSIDTVIIGYYKGKGKRTQFGLGALLTAIYDDKNDLFKSIAKIGTGMSEEKLKELERILSKLGKEKKPIRVNSEIEPDFWVEPKIVIEARADEITQSPLHTCGKIKNENGYALRFPRMISIRTDKKPEDATTEKEIIKLFNQQKQKIEKSEETNAEEN